MGATETKPDPIFAIIDRHVVAYTAADHAFKKGKPKEHLAKTLLDKADAILKKIVQTRPATAEGMAAKMEYLRARELQMDGGETVNRDGFLDATAHCAAFLVRRPFSAEYQNVLNHVAAMRAEKGAAREVEENRQALLQASDTARAA